MKNKLFNYVSYEGQNIRAPGNAVFTMPSQLERNGDFSNSLNRNGNIRQIFDPFTTQITGTSTATRDPFVNNAIPQTRHDATSRTVMPLVWEPNNPGDNPSGANNYRNVFPNTFKYWNLTNRTDWNVSDSVKVFGRISRFHTDQADPDYTGSIAQRRSGSARNAIQSSGDVVWTVNPTTVFNLRGSWSKITDSFDTPQAEIGAEGLQNLWPGNDWFASHVRDIPAVYFPEIDVRADGRSRFGRSGFWFQEPSTWNLDAKVSKQAGKHYIKAGGQFRHQRILAGRPRGMFFRFRPNQTADTIFSPNTGANGHAWASMLLGALDTGRVRTVPINRPRVNVWGFYVQDDIKLTQRVTLNLGLRYEYETAMVDPEDRLSRFMDFGQETPGLGGIAGQFPQQALDLRTTPLALNGAWTFTDGDNRQAWNPQSNVILPRAGIAIRLDDRTALRIGYSRFAIPPI